MAQRRHEEKVAYDTFAAFYGTFVSRVAKNNPENCIAKLFDVGVKLGRRMADDFFLKTKPKRCMTLEEISENASDSFFPHYFSFRPNFSQNIIFLRRFPLLKACKISGEYLEVIRGVLTGVYNYLSESKVAFEVVYDQQEFKILVRNDSHRGNLIVCNFIDVVPCGFEP